MSESTSRSVSPSRRQMALQLTCAIMGNPAITGELHEATATEMALRVLNDLEQRLRMAPTATRPPA